LLKTTFVHSSDRAALPWNGLPKRASVAEVLGVA